MKEIMWNKEKDIWLQDNRGVSFGQVSEIIQKQNYLAVLDHPNRTKYSHQRMFVIEIDNYAYLVPCVEDENKIFLKTIIPSRKARKQYL